MTANVTFTVSKEKNVIKIANAALRYRPSIHTQPKGNESTSFPVNKESRSAIKDEKEVNPSKSNYKTNSSVKRSLDGKKPSLLNEQESFQPDQTTQVITERYGIRPGIKIHFPKSKNPSNYRDAIIWTLEHDTSLKSHSVRLGITNGRETAVLEGDLVEGDMVITGEYISEEEYTSRSGSPLGGPFSRRRSEARSGRSRPSGTRR